MRPARHRAVGRSGIACALAALVVAACSHSPREQAKKRLASLHSWAVSTQLVGERWMEGAVPTPYASKTLQTFGRKVWNERRQTESGELPPDVKAFLVAGFDSTARATDSLLSVVDRNDKHAAADIVRRLSVQARAADSARERIGAQ
ncbi:MAG TPA: hypothetical protein VFK39_05855 [Gemmatimonadaceae bacterium]|nr:hypothetical protein [Gemmatimonadaceae bacterium]